MPEMGKYFKAYLLKQCRAYSQWHENAANARPVKREVGGTLISVIPPLTDDSIVYLQENYVVTDGVFEDEYIIFDDVTAGWKQYCRDTLDFIIPVYEPIGVPVSIGSAK